MGINVSTQFYENVYSDVFAAATEVLQTYVTENRQALKGKQAVNLVTGSGGVLDCGSGALKITTSAQITAETMLSVTTESSIKMANEIISKSLNNVEQTIDQTNKALNIGQISAASVTQKIRNEIVTTLQNKLTSQILTLSEISAAGEQVINVNISGGSIVRAGGGCEFREDMTIYGMSQTVSRTVVDALLESKALRDFASLARQTSTQTNTGVSAPWEALRDAVIAGAVVFGLVLVVLIGVLVKVGPGKAVQAVRGTPKRAPTGLPAADVRLIEG